jgi:ADP-ribosyl-[dinitrogen reductase] hydrolase
MRLAAVPIAYHYDMEKAKEVARLQSLTTHQGEEAAECCKLLTQIVINAIKHGDGTTSILNSINFQSTEKSVEFLAKSLQEEPTEGNSNMADRNWNWKDPNYRYSPDRATKQPGYVGSYVMDAVSMALHCVWTTTNFQVFFKEIKLRLILMLILGCDVKICKSVW